MKNWMGGWGMSRSLERRCQEVAGFLQAKQAEKIQYAKGLLQSSEEERFEYAVRYLEAELRMHQEVRTLWPYLLAIPCSQEADMFCRMYDCSLEEFGEVIHTRINQSHNSLSVIASRMWNTALTGPFWLAMRQELLKKVCREAQQILENQGTP